MDKNIQIQLGSTKHINSTDVDTYDKIQLNNQRNKILEYNVRNVLSITEVFDLERQNTPIYRIYGGLEYLSILNGLKTNYKTLGDYFRTSSYNQIINSNSYKNIFNSFDFYLLRPSGYTQLNNTDNEYVILFEVIATPYNFEIFNVGYSRNIFDEPKYGFTLNKDFNILNWTDGFGFPMTELYLYPFYNKTSNSSSTETISGITWSNDGSSDLTTNLSSNLNIGDVVVGNKIKFNKSEYLQTIIEPQTYYITTQYEESEETTKDLQWKYEPFIPIKSRYFSNEVSRVNTGGTSYEEVSEIPSYAIDLGNGNMVWREILEQGYIDPLTGEGVDYPFVNKRRYLFSNKIINIVPDLEHENTAEVFNEIRFNDPTSLNYSPLGELNNIGQPCQ